MSYYDTIEEDLARAKTILEKGKPTAESLEGVNAPAIISMAGGAIYGDDIYAAYKLLESFVAEIARLRDRLQIDPGGSDQIDELEAAIGHLRAHNDLLQAGVEDCAKAVDEMQAEITALRAQIVVLERESDAAGQGWTECIELCIELNKRQGEVLHHEGIEHSECQEALINAQAEIQALRVDAERERAARRVVDEALRQALDARNAMVRHYNQSAERWRAILLNMRPMAEKAVRGMPGRHDGCTWRLSLTLGDARQVLDLAPKDVAPVRPLYPDLPGGTNHPQQFGKKPECAHLYEPGGTMCLQCGEVRVVPT